MNKRLRSAYWITTIIFVLWLLADGISGVLQVQAGKDSFLQLGYPFYLLTIIGGAKILAAIAIFQNKYRILKEWAYAGYAIDCLGAALSWYFVGVTTNAIAALVFLAFMVVTYVLWKKTY